MAIIVGEHPFDFFLQALAEALSAEHVSVTPATHVYLAQVLVRHINPRWHPSETLGDRVAKALGGGLTPAQRRQAFQELGDMILVCTGLYPEYGLWMARGIHVKYQIQIGRGAYARLGQEPYQEIADKFHRLVGALIYFGTEHSLATARDVVRLYELWHQTHSNQIARILASQDIQVGETEPHTPS